MVRGKAYKVPPLEIHLFQEVFKITSEELLFEYKMYLESNKNTHYYAGYKTMHNWYINQIKQGN